MERFCVNCVMSDRLTITILERCIIIFNTGTYVLAWRLAKASKCQSCHTLQPAAAVRDPIHAVYSSKPVVLNPWSIWPDSQIGRSAHPYLGHPGHICLNQQSLSSRPVGLMRDRTTERIKLLLDTVCMVTCVLRRRLEMLLYHIVMILWTSPSSCHKMAYKIIETHNVIAI